MPRATPLLLAATLAAAALAAPGAASAQSAGDDQYADPFGQVPDDRPRRDTGPPEPVPQQAPNGSAGQVAGSGQAAPTGSRPQPPAEPDALPRTGMAAWALGAIGLVLLGTGVVLGRRLRARTA